MKSPFSEKSPVFIKTHHSVGTDKPCTIEKHMKLLNQTMSKADFFRQLELLGQITSEGATSQHTFEWYQLAGPHGTCEFLISLAE